MENAPIENEIRGTFYYTCLIVTAYMFLIQFESHFNESSAYSMWTRIAF